MTWHPTITTDDGRTYTLRPKGCCLDCGMPIYDDPTASVSTGLCPCWDEPPRDVLLSLRPLPRDIGRAVAVVTWGQPVRHGRITAWGHRCHPTPVTVQLDHGPTVAVSPDDCVLMEDR